MWSNFKLIDYIKAIVEANNQSKLNKILYESILSEIVTTDDFRIISEIYMYKSLYLDAKGGANSYANT